MVWTSLLCTIFGEIHNYYYYLLFLDMEYIIHCHNHLPANGGVLGPLVFVSLLAKPTRIM